MINKDYILRMIEQLNLVLSRLLFHKDSNDYKAMMEELARSYSRITGVESELVEKFSTEALIRFLKPGSRYESEKSMIIGRLLFEEAETMKLSAEPDELVMEKTEKALNLLLESYINNSELSYADESIELIIPGFPLLDSDYNTRMRLIKYFEEKGKYSRTEDILYSLLDDGYDDVKSELISFYQRLNKKTDEELERGNLPREEVLEGLERISL